MKVALPIVAILTLALICSPVMAQVDDQGPAGSGKYVGKPVAPAAGMPPAPKVEPGQKWVHNFGNFANAKTTTALTELMKKAKADGYTAMLVGDTKFAKLQLTDAAYKKALQDFRKACKDNGMKLVVGVGASWGYSETFLSHDPNLAEGMPVTKAPFIVKDGKLVAFDDGTTKLINGSFDEMNGDTPAGWTTNDLGKNLFVDKDVKCDGADSIRIEVDGDKKAGFITQKIKVKPGQYYIVSAKAKQEGFNGREVRLWVRTEKDGKSYWLNESEIDVLQGHRLEDHRQPLLLAGRHRGHRAGGRVGGQDRQDMV